MFNWIYKVPSPCYVIDKAKLTANLELLLGLQRRTGCKVLLAQKAFSMYSLYPFMAQYLAGTAASGLYEAKLGREEMGGEVHVFSPAYTREDFAELVQICDHMVFNSPEQWAKYKDALPATAGARVSPGLRVNPQHSTQQHAIYDPCAPFSRLGTTAEGLSRCERGFLSGIEGLHFHTLCQQNADALASTLDVVIEKFGHLLPQLKWLNMGGGHHITRADYDMELLERCIKRVQDLGLQVYLEPGEAVALDAGYLVTSVLEVMHNDMDIAVLDASAACHMPDVLEMPYKPTVLYPECGGGSRLTRLGGNTCLAGDIIGDYCFDQDKPLKVGDRLVFADMAIYTMVKNNTFNGVPLPSIALLQPDGGIEVVKEFGYEDFKSRL